MKMPVYHTSTEVDPLKSEIPPVDPTDVSTWKILIVDDVHDNISIAQTVLQFNGAEVMSAIHGKDGLQQMETFMPNIILLDLSMPEMNGWEMHSHLHADPATASITVIALTAHAMQGDREKVMTAGFDGYIPKPFSVRTIIDEIKLILNESGVAKID